MAPSQSETQLAKLINTRMVDLGISRTELVERMVFANLAKGLRRLDCYLATGENGSHLLYGLPKVLSLSTDQIETAAAETRQQNAEADEEAARDRFRPHILALTQGVRYPFFVQSVAWHQKVMPLPKEIAPLSSSKQVRQVAGIIRQHFREHEGMLGVWGKITGYRLQRTYDHAVLLNVDGTVRDGFIRNTAPPPPVLQVSGKQVPDGLFGEG